MLSAVQETAEQQKEITLIDLIKADLPSDDEHDVDYEIKDVEEVSESEDDQEEENEEDVDPNEIVDIVVGSAALRGDKELRSRIVDTRYRESTIMQDFKSDDEDHDYRNEDEDESIDEINEEEGEQAEEVDLSDTEIDDLVVDAKSEILNQSSSTILRHGKAVPKDIQSITESISSM